MLPRRCYTIFGVKTTRVIDEEMNFLDILWRKQYLRGNDSQNCPFGVVGMDLELPFLSQNVQTHRNCDEEALRRQQAIWKCETL